MTALRMTFQAIVLAAVVAALAYALTGIGARRLNAALAKTTLLNAQAAELRARFAATTATKEEVALPAALSHTGDTPATATLALQRQIVDLGNANNLTLLTFGAGRIPYQLTTPTVAVELEAQGEWSDAIRFLAGIEALSPRVAVASLTLRAMPAASQPNAQAPVSLRIVAWGLHPAEEA